MNPPKTVTGPVPLIPGISQLDFSAYASLQMSNAHGTVIVSLHGGQVLSWIPAGHREVFWLSRLAKPAPAAIRGGAPVCWPWFGKQGMPSDAMQHGPVRNVMWKVTACGAGQNGNLSLSLQPDRASAQGSSVDLYAKHLDVRLDVELGTTLRMGLRTYNRGTEPFALTQALHSYFAVGDAEQVQLHGVEGLRFDSRVDSAQGNLQVGPFKLDALCDNTYAQVNAQTEHHYRLIDPAWRRQICLTTQSSQSVVVWNPGAKGAAAMADMPDTAWQDFLCIEAANAGSDIVILAGGSQHYLQQTLRCEVWPHMQPDNI